MRSPVLESSSPDALAEWKKRGAERLAHFKEQLSKPPANAAKARARREWLDRMGNVIQSRIEWLEARLEHANALVQVLHQSAGPSEPPAPKARPQRSEVRRRGGGFKRT